jgi:hypothetical protein
VDSVYNGTLTTHLTAELGGELAHSKGASNKDPCSLAADPQGKHRPCSARPADRSLVAEDRSARKRPRPGGTGTRACSRRAHETGRRWQERRGTATRRGEAKAQVQGPVWRQMNTSERRSNDS